MPLPQKLLGHIFAIAVLGWLTLIVLTTKELRFLDGVNLIFHEAGHWIFAWGRELITAFGGTLLQLLVPIICAVAFWRRKAHISFMVMVWWVGQNLVNISVYIADARAQVLPLIGGDHDWTFILGRLGQLENDTAIGTFVLYAGAVCMIMAIAELGFRLIGLLQHRFHR